MDPQHGLRSSFVEWLRRLSGISDGERLPVWLVVVLLILHPSKIRTYLCRNYDPLMDVYTIEGLRISGLFLRRAKAGHYRDVWTRIVDINDDGNITMETKIEEFVKNV